MFSREMRRTRYLVWSGLLLGLALAVGAIPRRVPAPPPRPRMDTFWSLARGDLQPSMGDEDRALALARWIVRNATNDHRRVVGDGVPFFGLCGYRSTVFELLGKRAGLEVRRVAIDGFAGSGHTAVEVRWSGAWHYLDVTYAGYFLRGGRILSFDEIQAEPEGAIPGLVVIEGSLDRWPDGRPVRNAERMERNYTPENLRAATRVGLSGQASRGGSAAS